MFAQIVMFVAIVTLCSIVRSLQKCWTLNYAEVTEVAELARCLGHKILACWHDYYDQVSLLLRGQSLCTL